MQLAPRFTKKIEISRFFCLFETILIKAFFNRQGMDRKSDKALRDRDCRGKKESLSESVDHTLVGDRGRPYY